jgi:hypothetical protein
MRRGAFDRDDMCECGGSCSERALFLPFMGDRSTMLEVRPSNLGLWRRSHEWPRIKGYERNGTIVKRMVDLRGVPAIATTQSAVSWATAAVEPSAYCS